MSRLWMPGSRLLYGGLASPFLDPGPVSRVRGILSIAGKTRWVAGFTQRVAGTYVHSNRSCRLPPARQGMKAEVVVWYSELARRILPRPTPTPAGDKPPRYIFSFRHRPSVYNSARFAVCGEPASR